MPDFIHAEKWNAEIAAHRQRLAVGAHRHHRVVHLAVSGIDDVPVLVSQAQPLHAPDQGQAEERCVPAIIRTSGTDRVGLVAGSGKQLGNSALIGSVALHKEKPPDRASGLVLLLPKPGSRGLRGASRGSGRYHGTADERSQTSEESKVSIVFSRPAPDFSDKVAKAFRAQIWSFHGHQVTQRPLLFRIGGNRRLR